MALSTVDVPSDDSGQDDSDGTESLAWANGTPPARSPRRGAGPAYDVRLLEALRRISALEHERIEANRALNDALSRSMERERRLSDTQAELARARARFRTFVQVEVDRLTAENDEISRRLHELQSGIFWRFAVAIRALRARLRKRG